jgi:hypothetical protein
MGLIGADDEAAARDDVPSQERAGVAHRNAIRTLFLSGINLSLRFDCFNTLSTNSVTGVMTQSGPLTSVFQW